MKRQERRLAERLQKKRQGKSMRKLEEALIRQETPIRKAGPCRKKLVYGCQSGHTREIYIEAGVQVPVPFMAGSCVECEKKAFMPFSTMRHIQWEQDQELNPPVTPPADAWFFRAPLPGEDNMGILQRPELKK